MQESPLDVANSRGIRIFSQFYGAGAAGGNKIARRGAEISVSGGI